MTPFSRLSRGILLTLAAAAIARGESPAPDVIFVNGNVYTLNPARPRAAAIVVARDRIVAVGSNAEAQTLKRADTRIIDLGGRTVLPGLIDAHGHMAGLGAFALGRIDLSTAKSADEMVSTVAERARNAKPGEWIIGGRWDHESWPDRKLPTHEKLSAAAPSNPVWLRRVDGHAGLANAAAMKLAGVSRESASPSGGEILRDADGEPTGVFIDNAMTLIAARLPPESRDPAEPLRAAQRLCLAAGLTGVHDAGCSPADVEIYKQLLERGELTLRIYAMIDGNAAIPYFHANDPLIGDRLTVRAAKLYADGAMGSRGAWLLEPYADRPTDDAGKPYTGLNVMQPEFMRQVAETGLRRGFQVCTHAIGDRGNRETLDAYEAALKAHPTGNHRYRIEHAQLLAPQDIPRFAALGVIPSMQPTHCTSDMRWVDARVGSTRAAGAYAWADLLRSGAVLAFGSDFPVESHNPFFGLHAAVTRQDPAGSPAGGWRPQQRLSREEALRAFTLGAAYAAFEESHKGTLEPGKLADFIVLDRDVMTCDVDRIRDTRVLATYVGGQPAYELR